LNSQIAIHIYEWTVREYSNPSRTPGAIAFVGQMLVPPGAGAGWVGSPPRFSENLLDAWALAEEMRSRDYFWEASSFNNGFPFEFVFHRMGTQDISEDVASEGDTIQEAICLAALRAVGVEIVK
jgi:hypothetical protein